MNSAKKNARITGCIYLFMIVSGLFGLMYVPSKTIEYPDAAATAGNIISHEWLYRSGIISGLICQTLFVFLVLALNRLLKGVNEKHARLMVTFVIVSVPIAFLNEINRIAPLILLGDAEFLKVFKPDQLNALVMMFLDLFNYGNYVAGVFWGLWLLPFGYLVYKSGFIPRIIGIFLMVSCFGYLVESTTFLLIPQYYGIVSKITMVPSALGEFAVMPWLLIKGVKYEPSPVKNV
jgi:hypothetical protein